MDVAKSVDSWTEVHAKGDGRKPWNKGKRTGKWLAVDAAVTERRFRERRRRDVEKALALGVSLEFHQIADDYLHKRGEFRHG